jgi:hypothetical protein
VSPPTVIPSNFFPTLTPSLAEEVKNVIQDLFQILVQVSNYDAFGRPTRDALAQDLYAPPPITHPSIPITTAQLT